MCRVVFLPLMTIIDIAIAVTFDLTLFTLALLYSLSLSHAAHIASQHTHTNTPTSHVPLISSLLPSSLSLFSSSSYSSSIGRRDERSSFRLSFFSSASSPILRGPRSIPVRPRIVVEPYTDVFFSPYPLNALASRCFESIRSGSFDKVPNTYADSPLDRLMASLALAAEPTSPSYGSLPSLAETASSPSTPTL
jgi:hypothetical protein